MEDNHVINNNKSRNSNNIMKATKHYQVQDFKITTK